MKEYIDRMLHLTADIAEELLTLKDTGKDVDRLLSDKIAMLSQIARENMADDGQPGSPVNGEFLTEPVLPDIDEIESQALEEESTAEDDATAQKNEEEIVAEGAIGDSAMAEICADVAAADSRAMELADENDFSDDEQTHDDEAIAETTVEEETDDALPEEPEYDMPHHYSASDIRNAFTLNDVFLYQRTLFGGSPQRFKDSLKAIAECGSIAEAEDYLEQTQRINLESEDAKDFIAIIAPFIAQ